jgi:2-furoate---CoA ligase
MFDLGRTLLAVVERSPDALAIVDRVRRLSYAAWYREIGRVGAGWPPSASAAETAWL